MCHEFDVTLCFLSLHNFYIVNLQATQATGTARAKFLRLHQPIRMSTVRTTKHDYPREELNAMNMFYGGKRCVITKTLNNVQWGHMLDAALTSSNRIVSQTLIGSCTMMMMNQSAWTNA